jgi:hypothetical protein
MVEHIYGPHRGGLVRQIWRIQYGQWSTRAADKAWWQAPKGALLGCCGEGTALAVSKISC